MTTSEENASAGKGHLPILRILSRVHEAAGRHIENGLQRTPVGRLILNYPKTMMGVGFLAGCVGMAASGFPPDTVEHAISDIASGALTALAVRFVYGPHSLGIGGRPRSARSKGSEHS